MPAPAACSLLQGRRMIRSPQQRRVAQQDTLALPVYIIEDLVRQRLKTNITRWARPPLPMPDSTQHTAADAKL